MIVTDYFYTYGDKVLEDRVELLDKRDSYMTVEYSKMFKDQISAIALEGRTAVLYVGGVGVHNAEGRNYTGDFVCTQPTLESGPVIKELQAYMMHRYIGMLDKNNDIVYASINSNTCASSLYALYEAEGLLDRNVVDNVIVIAEEKTSLNTVRIFHEHNIYVKPGEGFACIVLQRDGVGPRIVETKWGYKYNRNPFLVDADGYRQVKSEADLVKGHKTGTEQNDTAEGEVFGSTFGYKDMIGHCQGASGLIEVCMVLDDKPAERVLCTASGLGGFYGSCIMEVCK